MKILWIHQNYVSSSDAGNSRAELVINSFLNAGWEVDLVCSNETYFGNSRNPNQNHRAGLHIHYLDLQSNNVNRLNGKKISYFKFCYRSIIYLRKLSKPDIIFCSSPPLPQILAGIFASQYFKARFVIEVRDLWPAFLIDGKLIRSKLLAKALYWIEALFYRQADQCILVSPGFYPYIQEMGINESQVIIAPTFENKVTAQKAEPSWRNKNNLLDEFLVLYSGSMNESYDIQLIVDTALKTISNDKNVVWIFAGDGREAFKIKALAKEYEQILYLGNLPKKEMISVMHSCNIGVNSHAKWSLLDTVITGKLIDYLSTSLPIVSCSLGIIEEILKHSGAGITTLHDANSLSKAILHMKKLDPNELRIMGEKGSTWLDVHINSENMEIKIQSAIKNALLNSSFSKVRIIVNMIKAFNDIIKGKAEKGIYKCYRNEVRENILKRAFADWIIGDKKS